MEELAKVRRVIERKLDGAPHETLLVVDATTGQNGVQQAKLFNEAVGVTGVALTKLDGSAKGGVAIPIAYELGLPVKLVGVGEQIDDLRPFDPLDFAKRARYLARSQTVHPLLVFATKYVSSDRLALTFAIFGRTTSTSKLRDATTAPQSAAASP